MKKITILIIILLSINFYGQWTPQISGVSNNLNDVYCISESTVITVGNAGTILKTIDGGNNWVQKSSGITANLLKVQFANATVGYAIGSSGKILKTLNGGENWTTILSGNTLDLYGLSVTNENILYLSGKDGLIKKSTDGGISFTMLSAPDNKNVLDIQFFNQQVGYALVQIPDSYNREKKLYKTIDNGESWTLLLIDNIQSFFFLNENIGFFNKNFYVYKTTDGGLSSNIVGYSNQYENDIFSLEENLVWNVGENILMCYCSTSCIIKHDLLNTPTAADHSSCFNFIQVFNALHFANLTVGYIVGNGGTIYKNATGLFPQLATESFNKNNVTKIYPNPTSDFINITFNELQNQAFTVEIKDSLGKLIFSNQYSNIDKMEINAKSFSKGLYFLTIFDENKEQTQKVIIE